MWALLIIAAIVLVAWIASRRSCDGFRGGRGWGRGRGWGPGRRGWGTGWGGWGWPAYDYAVPVVYTNAVTVDDGRTSEERCKILVDKMCGKKDCLPDLYDEMMEECRNASA